MLRILAVAIVWSLFTTSVWAQAQPVAGTAAAQTTAPVKPAVKKSVPKAITAAKPRAPAESGPCQLGVIPAIGEKFVVQKVGITVFGNEQTEVPIDAWALDDLVVARVRAAAPGISVRRIAYAKGAFDPWYHGRGKLFFNNPDDNLTAVVRQVAANASCERYVVVITFTGQLEGTNQTLEGIGVLNHGTSLFSRTSLYANISVKVFDGQTFAIHRNPPVGLGSVLAGAFQGQDPLTKLDNAAFPEPAAAAASNATLRDGTRALLTDRLDKVLPVSLKE